MAIAIESQNSTTEEQVEVAEAIERALQGAEIEVWPPYSDGQYIFRVVWDGFKEMSDRKRQTRVKKIVKKSGLDPAGRFVGAFTHTPEEMELDPEDLW